MRLSKLLSVAVAACTLAACSGDADSSSGATTTAAEAVTTSSTTTTAPAPEGAATITVEDPGQDPRQALRLDVAAGDRDAVTQRQEMQIEVRADGQVQSAPTPVTELDLTYTVDEVSDRRIVASATYDDVRVVETAGIDPATVEEVRQLLEGFRQATAHTVHTPEGAILEARFEGLELPGAAGAFVEQLATSFSDGIEALSVPFPAEPVGVGARWRVESETEIAGLPVALTSVVQLQEVTGDRAAGTLQQIVRFLPGDVELLGMPATVISGELTGGGPVEWDLRGGLLPRSDLTMSGTTVMEVDGVRIEQHQDQRITVTPR